MTGVWLVKTSPDTVSSMMRCMSSNISVTLLEDDLLGDRDLAVVNEEYMHPLKDEVCDDLQNIATKDISTKEIENDLLGAHSKGQEKLNNFIQERFIAPEPRQVKFQDPLPKKKTFTFASLYEVKHKDSKQKCIEKSIKVDRKIIQRLITAYESGRHVNLLEVMMHELSTVPLALAETYGRLRSGSKPDLAKILTSGYNVQRA
ncbi:hypothetical protein Pcinc_014315 [Petrolisthes cinctipes]|uniref:Uncharacterized protein n=1 Tax=Petrolisthes cinctipes TaxID=88211 RepID=A0AAE1FV43_PETCI|nr:hypothetical protein Pcinc_014315 [Petrolisthes cinctipes]